MTATLIGILTGVAVILFISMLKGLDKPTLYGLTLTGIAFLYVGYTWSDPLSLVINCIQAVFFVFLSYYGMKRNFSIMIAGYFLHGLWDLIYDYLHLPSLRPPHYDLFCLAIDVIMGAYLALLQYRMSNHVSR